MTGIAAMEGEATVGLMEGLIAPGVIFGREHRGVRLIVDAGDAAQMVGIGIVELALSVAVLQHVDDTMVEIVDVARCTVLGDALVVAGIERGTLGGPIMLEHGLPTLLFRSIGKDHGIAVLRESRHLAEGGIAGCLSRCRDVALRA